MFNLGDAIGEAINSFFSNLFNDLISSFANTLANIWSTSLNVLSLPLVKNGIVYAQALAFTLLVLKVMNEAFQTYILYQNGDSDADPSGLLIRTAQAVAIIAALPWIVLQIFTLGTKVASDVASLGTGKTGIADWAFLLSTGGGLVLILFGLIVVISFLIIAIQSTIRGAELALMAVLGPIMALNLTANNRSMWSAWLRQVIIICVSQAVQIFMLQGALSMLTSQVVSSEGRLYVFGWLWVTIKSPKYIQQIVYSTGLGAAVGGTTRQAGSVVIMRKMMAMK